MFDKFCQGQNLFIADPGCSGKSFLIKTIVQHLRTGVKSISFQVTSTTGCSGVLLSTNIQIKGKNLPVQTINAFRGISLCKKKNSVIVDNVVKNKFLFKAWRQIKVSIIDKVSMMCCRTFNILDSPAKLTRKNALPFGGIQVVLLGDFLQLPLILDISNLETAKFCFESGEWCNVIPIENQYCSILLSTLL